MPTPITTVLTQRNDSLDKREWTLPGHTVAKPALLKQSRVSPTTPTGRASDDIRLICGTVDSAGVANTVPLMFVVTVTRQATMVATEASTPLAQLRDIVNSDNFAAVVSGQAYLA